MWVVTYTWENNAPVFRLHLLSLTNLTEIKNTIITASHTLSDGSVNNFNPQYQRQRAALLLQNLNVYAAFASFCDLGGNNSRGWVLGWQAETLTPLAANELTDTQTLAQTPNGTANVFLSSIWMSGYGVASDSSGDLFFTTGNSDTVKVNNYPESAVRLSSDLTTVKDFFTPYIFCVARPERWGFQRGRHVAAPCPERAGSEPRGRGRKVRVFVHLQPHAGLHGRLCPWRSGRPEGNLARSLLVRPVVFHGIRWLRPRCDEPGLGCPRYVASRHDQSRPADSRRHKSFDDEYPGPGLLYLRLFKRHPSRYGDHLGGAAADVSEHAPI